MKLNKRPLTSNSIIITLVVFIFGIAITHYFYHNKKSQQLSVAQASLQQKAQMRVKDIEAAFNRSYFQVASIANLFSSSEWVSFEEYVGFINKVYPSFPQGRRISVLNYVNVNQLDLELGKIKNNPDVQFKEFAIFDFVDQKKVYPASAANEHVVFPQYTFPAPPNDNFLGRNIRPDSPIGPLLYKVIESHTPMITDLSAPVGNITDKPFFIHIHPIVNNSESNTNWLTGLILSSQYIEDIFTLIDANATTDLFNYYLFDNQGNLYSYPDKTLTKSSTNTLQANPFFQSPLQLEGNQWRIIIEPKTQLKTDAAQLLLGLYITGGLLSFVVALLVFQSIRQQETLKEQVALKTSALEQAVVQLDQQKSQLKSQNIELESAVEKANQAARVKAEFLANMSHEIRTPLNGIVGFTQLLKMTNLDHQQVDQLSKIEISAKHLMTVINDVLDFSKIESGKIELEAEPFSIYNTIDFIHSTFDDEIKDKGLSFEITLAKNVHPDLMGDTVRVNQILLNLLSNAIKFTNQGKVTLDITMQDSEQSESLYLVFTVSDTGIGMSESELTRLFRAFTQADTSTTRKYGGTGLGLSICHKLCQLMGGEVKVTSEENIGSVFTAKIKLQVNNKVIIEDDTTLKFERQISVLLIDDNAKALEIVEQHLLGLDARVDSFVSPKQALTQIKGSSSYDVILMDWCMPEMAGDQFLNQLKSQGLNKTPPVVILSAYDRAHIKHQTSNLAITKILRKPCAMSELFQTLSMAVFSDANQYYSAEKPKNLSGIRVLVAEDNNINQAIIKKILINELAEGYYVNDGQECIEHLDKNHDYDVILMDIQMPILDGIQATHWIRSHKNPAISSIPIIALTANVLKDDIDHYLSIGMNAHMAKPLNVEKLREYILFYSLQSNKVGS